MEPAALLAFLASIVAPLALAAIWHRTPWVLSRQVARVTPWLSGWPAPVMMGLIAMGLIVRVWGSTDEPGVVHDERAIVLQARIFAGGQWRGPTPPEPAAFEQMHVFAEPGVASKYPPFHSAVLVPGVWLSRPGLMPVVLSGVATGLFFALARNALGGWVALASTCLLMTSQPDLFWRSTYFSETTTSALWLGVVWCVLEWQRSARWWLLALASLCFALMGLTRPLSGVLLLLPVAALTARGIYRTRDWKQALVPIALLLATIGVVALWSERTLGSPTVNPYSEYSRLNMPFDRMGFGVDPTPPIRQFPADLQGVFDQWRRIHAEHTWPRLPTIAAYRALTLLQQLGGGWRRGLLVLFVAGIGISTTLEGLLIWSVACMFLGYLAFAHPSAWTVYYVEIFPAVFLLAVAQYWRLGMKGEPDPDRKRARGDALLAVSLAVVLPLMWADVGDARVMRQVFLSFHHHAVSRFDAIPESRALVFVRPGPHHDPNLSLISAPVNGSSDRLWVVRSTGDESRRLCEIARDRAPYVYDEESGSLLRGGCPSP